MALTKNAQPVYEIGEVNEAPLAVGAVIFLGACLGYTGNDTVRPLNAGDKFAGFAEDSANQTLGDVNARFKDRGFIVLTVAGLAANTPIGTSVYASDDGTFTLTATGNSLIGTVRRLHSATKAVVAFVADNKGAALTSLAALTDTSGGVPAAGIVDVGAAFNQATINANFATLNTRLNAILAALK